MFDIQSHSTTPLSCNNVRVKLWCKSGSPRFGVSFRRSWRSVPEATHRVCALRPSGPRAPDLLGLDIRLALFDSEEHAFCRPDHGVFRFADRRRLSFARKDPLNLEMMGKSNLYNKRHKQAKSIGIFIITNSLPKICYYYSQIGKLRRLVEAIQEETLAHRSTALTRE
jgi:hypothetical protein